MHEKLSSFFIFDSYDAQIHTETRSILVSSSVQILIKIHLLDRKLVIV